ncbi:hypothetical protein Anas_13539 [Armadillidium nasatum]|uniref:Uncharacterized protein n=1 Tax=Armadillidium nasatum TaxID=96803 RepID=A0A5N5T7I6_9CRUS|nr:hypothetical protein Anas_13539 [Armadillidium nasatum]
MYRLSDLKCMRRQYTYNDEVPCFLLLVLPNPFSSGIFVSCEEEQIDIHNAGWVNPYLFIHLYIIFYLFM